jgi:hypothetical protein
MQREHHAQDGAPSRQRQYLVAALGAGAVCMAVLAVTSYLGETGAAPVRTRPPVPSQPARHVPPAPAAPASTLSATELVHLDDIAHRQWQAAQPVRPTVVYAAQRGSRYHTGECGTLANGRSPMRLHDAQASGYSPCAVCKPEGWAGYVEKPQPPAAPQQQTLAENVFEYATEALTPRPIIVPYLPPPLPPPAPQPSRTQRARAAAAAHENAMDADYGQRKDNTPVGTKTTVRPYWWGYGPGLRGGVRAGE